MEVKWQFHTAAVFISKKRDLITHWIRGLGPKIILDVVKNRSC
jgi:hypothetical protein